jgi:hypothetical protein
MPGGARAAGRRLTLIVRLHITVTSNQLLSFVLVPMVLGAAIIVAVTRSNQIANRQLLSEGLIGKAVILRYSRLGRDRFVEYQFVPDGCTDAITCKRLLLGTYWSRWFLLPVGAQVPVRYMRQYPSISILEPYAKFQSAT